MMGCLGTGIFILDIREFRMCRKARRTGSSRKARSIPEAP